MEYLKMNNQNNCSRVLIATRDKNVENILLKELLNYEIFMNCYDQSGSTLLSIMEDDFELVIIDDELMGLRGHKLIPLIKKIRPKLPIIYLNLDSLDKDYQTIDVALKIDKPLNEYKVAEILKEISSCLHNYGINKDMSVN